MIHTPEGVRPPGHEYGCRAVGVETPPELGNTVLPCPDSKDDPTEQHRGVGSPEDRVPLQERRVPGLLSWLVTHRSRRGKHDAKVKLSAELEAEGLDPNDIQKALDRFMAGGEGRYHAEAGLTGATHVHHSRGSLSSSPPTADDVDDVSPRTTSSLVSEGDEYMMSGALSAVGETDNDSEGT